MDEAERCTDIVFMGDGRIPYAGTPAEVKALVPGVLFEVAAPDPRAALAVLTDADGVISAHLYGDVVRVLSDSEGPGAAALLGQVRATGLTVTEARPTEIDMEAAFAYLAEQVGDAS
jgi:ABC-type multidrug transport system ATPase subunit